MTLPHRHTFDAIGTKWQIESLRLLDEPLLSTIHNCIEKYDRTYSRFRSDSLVTKMTDRIGIFNFPDDCVALMRFYRSLYDISDGRLTPLIGSALQRAGYDATYSFQQQHQHALPTWDEAMKWHDTSVTTTQPIVLDIGAAGKGHLIDMISTILDKYDVKEYVIDASGDSLHRGKSENIIGLEDPRDTSKIIGTVLVQNASICASASNRRIWGEGMHHIFNPDTMQPEREIIASWVTASDAMIADGIATALFFTSPEKLQNSFDFDYVRMHHDGSVDHSVNFNGELFT